MSPRVASPRAEWRGVGRALRFVLLIGIVNLFADFTYEGGRGIVGAYLGHLGASGAIVGIVAGGGELAGYAIRSVAGVIADRTGLYWLDVWVGYAINMLCVPALALTGSWPAAAGLVIGERIGRGIRKPVTTAMLSNAGTLLGSGRVFGLNELLDQIGATVGPLVVALALARGGYRYAFGFLIVPALATLTMLAFATPVGLPFAQRGESEPGRSILDAPAFRRYAIGGTLVAAGYVDFALIAFRFQRDHVATAPLISVWFAVAMAVGAIAAPILGRLFDRVGKAVVTFAVALSAAATPLAFLGHGALAGAGVALWGVGTAVQDALLLALVTSVLARRRRATSFGLYDLIFGSAWFAGSVVAGILLDHSIAGLVVFSTLLQLAAIPFFTARVTPRAAR
ncbi:MAG: MFS transporter [Candidatus Eremiobacteraeota bacterium]|nr:MFS transporter [Candidatus Eremiobacteraeota bacterium]